MLYVIYGKIKNRDECTIANFSYICSKVSGVLRFFIEGTKYEEWHAFLAA